MRLEMPGSSTANRMPAIFLLLMMFAVACSAQDYVSQTGSPAFSANQPVVFGFANLANGNIHLEIPIASAPQRGELAFALKLVYDSRIWQVVNNGSSSTWQPTNVPNSQGGWRFVSNVDPGTVSYSLSTTSCGVGRCSCCRAPPVSREISRPSTNNSRRAPMSTVPSGRRTFAR